MQFFIRMAEPRGPAPEECPTPLCLHLPCDCDDFRVIVAHLGTARRFEQRQGGPCRRAIAPGLLTVPGHCSGPRLERFGILWFTRVLPSSLRSSWCRLQRTYRFRPRIRRRLALFSTLSRFQRTRLFT